MSNTGALRSLAEVQRAHDQLQGIVLERGGHGSTTDPTFGALLQSRIDDEAFDLMRAQLDVLCWSLTHDHNRSFERNLQTLDAVMEEAGFRLAQYPDGETKVRDPSAAISVEMLTEHRRAHEAWGGGAHDATLHPNDWAALLVKYLGRVAMVDVEKTDDLSRYRSALIVIGGVAISAVRALHDLAHADTVVDSPFSNPIAHDAATLVVQQAEERS